MSHFIHHIWNTLSCMWNRTLPHKQCLENIVRAHIYTHTHKQSAIALFLLQHQVWKEVTLLSFLWDPLCSKRPRLPLSDRHMHEHTMSSSSRCIYLFSPPLFICERWSLSLLGLVRGTSNRAAQAKYAPSLGEQKKGTLITVTHVDIITTCHVVSPTLLSTSFSLFSPGLHTQEPHSKTLGFVSF